jgi:hypothetical protein
VKLFLVETKDAVPQGSDLISQPNLHHCERENPVPYAAVKEKRAVTSVLKNPLDGPPNSNRPSSLYSASQIF